MRFAKRLQDSAATWVDRIMNHEGHEVSRRDWGPTFLVASSQRLAAPPFAIFEGWEPVLRVGSKKPIRVCRHSWCPLFEMREEWGSLILQQTPDALTLLSRRHRRCRSWRAGIAARFARDLTGARPGFCCHWRGEGLPAPSHLPTAPGSCRREEIRRGRLPPSRGAHQCECRLGRERFP